MSDTLRDRIIAAIATADQDWCSDNPLYEDMADAVIAELELHREVERSQTGTNHQAHREYNLLFDPVIATRWVTDWKAE